jgi:hypothetical protein
VVIPPELQSLDSPEQISWWGIHRREYTKVLRTIGEGLLIVLLTLTTLVSLVAWFRKRIRINAISSLTPTEDSARAAILLRSEVHRFASHFDLGKIDNQTGNAAISNFEHIGDVIPNGKAVAAALAILSRVFPARDLVVDGMLVGTDSDARLSITIATSRGRILEALEISRTRFDKLFSHAPAHAGALSAAAALWLLCTVYPDRMAARFHSANWESIALSMDPEKLWEGVR